MCVCDCFSLFLTAHVYIHVNYNFLVYYDDDEILYGSMALRRPAVNMVTMT